MADQLTGLFGNQSQEKSELRDTAEAIKNLSRRNEEQPRVKENIGVHLFKQEVSSSLDSGKGRDDLVELVYRHIECDYDEVSGWEEYNHVDAIELSAYLLDELDTAEKGYLRGKDVRQYLERFVEQDGEPDFLEDYSCESGI